MRGALRQTFSALREERDRLSAIFEALADAVMVVQPDGEVRFSNAAAADLIGEDGRAIDAAAARGCAGHRGAAVAENDALRVGDRVYSLNARQLPAEGAVLAVVRDRTEELRREVAEREFVSNAAHELRNPIAGISGAIEVLRAGRQGRPRGPRALPLAALRGRRADQPADRVAAHPGADGGGRRGRHRGARRRDRGRGGDRGGRGAGGDRGRGRVRPRPRRPGRPGAAAPGADRPAHQRVQEHAAAGQGVDPRPARRRRAR